MKKENTIGKIGERLFKELLVDNDISFIDNTNKKEKRFIVVDSVENPYSYFRKTDGHGFDFIISGLNIEIKTSTIHNNKINFTWVKNDTENIDYIIGIVMGESLLYYIFDNNFIKNKTGVGFKIDSKLYKQISENELIKLLSSKKQLN